MKQVSKLVVFNIRFQENCNYTRGPTIFSQHMRQCLYTHHIWVKSFFYSSSMLLGPLFFLCASSKNLTILIGLVLITNKKLSEKMLIFSNICAQKNHLINTVLLTLTYQVLQFPLSFQLSFSTENMKLASLCKRRLSYFEYPQHMLW